MSAAVAARLLIVDDELAQLRALCDTLELEGYTTRGFSSAEHALAELRPGEVDLLLTDLMMPEMDGIELINAARQIDASLGAIVMTGHGTIDTAVQAMQGGALDYILKPFKLNVMLPVISRALAVQRLQRENGELQERERRRSEELAAAYQTLESFSYSVSHDLRSPLRAIEGFAQILLDDYGPKLGNDGHEVVRIIHDGCRKMDQLIVGLLAFSQSGRHPLKRVRIDMAAMARDAAAEVRASYAGSTPLIEIGNLPYCEGDATVMRQVWCNLIGNALKYSAKRTTPTVTISGHVADNELHYRVRDNGAGFDMRYAHKLFAVFQRLHGEDEFAGTGVGLAIVHRVLTRHGGRVWAEGTPDAGACFQFALPIVSECAPVHITGEPGAV
jgi:two-component system sensor histidine kinase/response regulator